MAEKQKKTSKDKQVVEFNPTPILEEIFEKGYATKKIEVLPGKLQAVVRNVSAQDQLDIEKEIDSVKGSYTFILHTYSIDLLSVTLLSYGDKEFNTREEAKAFLTDKTTTSLVINKLVREQNIFDKEVAMALGLDNIETAFFDQGQPPTGPEPLQEELTLEKKEASGK